VGSQCSSCGAYFGGDAEAPIEIDERARRARPTPGVVGPLPARLGGAGGEPGLEVAEVQPRRKRVTRAMAEEIEGGFGARERARRTLFWRATRLPLLALFAWFTASHLLFDSKWVFLDNVNLLLHEAGHVLWGWGNEAQRALGGTLGQLMWPAIFAVYFRWWRTDRFAAWCCVWWFGQNFMSISRYMNDAAAMQLPLVGGDQHDWNFLFRRWHVLDDTTEIARFFFGLGAVIMVATLAWLAWRAINPDRFDVDKLD